MYKIKDMCCELKTRLLNFKKILHLRRFYTVVAMRLPEDNIHANQAINEYHGVKKPTGGQKQTQYLVYTDIHRYVDLKICKFVSLIKRRAPCRGQSPLCTLKNSPSLKTIASVIPPPLEAQLVVSWLTSLPLEVHVPTSRGLPANSRQLVDVERQYQIKSNQNQDTALQTAFSC